MVKRLSLLCVCLLAASPVTAATLVTWQADGVVTSRTGQLVLPEPGVPIAPPIGAPLSVTLMFDPASAVQTSFGGVAFPTPGCRNVAVSGSVTIGGYTAALGGQSQGFTQSNLPFSTPCQPGSQQTQFELHVPAAPDDNPFKLPPGILFLTYRDLLVQDAFPNSPTPASLAVLAYYDMRGDARWIFDGRAQLTALEQPSAVPEPGTMTLLGIGLAAAYRKRQSTLNRSAK